MFYFFRFLPCRCECICCGLTKQDLRHSASGLRVIESTGTVHSPGIIVIFRFHQEKGLKKERKNENIRQFPYHATVRDKLST